MTKPHRVQGQLSEKDLVKYRSLLLAKKSEILSNVWAMEDETIHRFDGDQSSSPMDMADLSSDSFELENTIGLMESERRILANIEDALERIENGTFGTCEGNGEAIGKRRLDAIPWARYCVACASLDEQGRLFLADDAERDDSDDDGEDD